jgi:nitrogen fixation/metabolism regulation signal transduction histidine kinase
LRSGNPESTMSQTQLGDVVANLLANAIDVIENANLAADELHNPWRIRLPKCGRSSPAPSAPVRG